MRWCARASYIMRKHFKSLVGHKFVAWFFQIRQLIINNLVQNNQIYVHIPVVSLTESTKLLEIQLTRSIRVWINNQCISWFDGT